MSKFVLTCHDCELELIINAQYGEIEALNILHCPVCGGTDNIDVVVKGTKNE